MAPDAKRRPPGKGRRSQDSLGGPFKQALAGYTTDETPGSNPWNPYLHRVRWRQPHWHSGTHQVRYFSRKALADRYAAWRRAAGAEVEVCRSDQRVTWVPDDGS
jgi:hypothetical protein